MKNLRLIIAGFGAVGQSLVSLLKNRMNWLREKYGLPIKVVAVIDRGGAAIEKEGLNPEKLIKTKKIKGTVASYPEKGVKEVLCQEVIEETEAEVVVEVTSANDLSTGEPGFSNITTALKTGKNVVTTNKVPLVLALPALMDLAEHNSVLLRFSGTVGGGTPILNFGKECLQGEKIISIKGVLNGTTNFILTEMEKGESFHNALLKAKKLGYCEENPSLDIDGLDTAFKLVILANWVMDKEVTLKNVKIKGIRGIEKEELTENLKKGYTIKLIGSIEEKIEVKPSKISLNNPLNVKGVLNAVMFKSEISGNKTIIGPGSGGLATANSVIRDLISIKRELMMRMVR